MIYEFLEAHWNIVKWVVLGAVIFEVITISKIFMYELSLFWWKFLLILESTNERLLGRFLFG